MLLGILAWRPCPHTAAPSSFHSNRTHSCGQHQLSRMLTDGKEKGHSTQDAGHETLCTQNLPVLKKACVSFSTYNVPGMGVRCILAWSALVAF